MRTRLVVAGRLRRELDLVVSGFVWFRLESPVILTADDQWSRVVEHLRCRLADQTIALRAAATAASKRCHGNGKPINMAVYTVYRETGHMDHHNETADPLSWQSKMVRKDLAVKLFAIYSLYSALFAMMRCIN